MYTSGQGSGKEKRKRKRAASTEGRKHTIKKRTKAVSKFAKQQVKDTITVGAIMLGINVLNPLTMVGNVLVASAAFVAKKGINAGVRFGKKHTIRKREKSILPSSRTMVGAAIRAAAITLPVLLIGPSPVAIAMSVAGAVSMGKFLFSKKARLKRKKIRDAREK